LLTVLVCPSVQRSADYYGKELGDETGACRNQSREQCQPDDEVRPQLTDPTHEIGPFQRPRLLVAGASQTLAQQLLPKCVVRGNQKGLRSALWRAVGYEADTDIARFVRHL